MILTWLSDLITLSKALIKGKGRAPELGTKGIPAVLPDSTQELQLLLDDPDQCQWAEQFLIGWDSLHNLKGDYAHLIERMRKWKDWDDEAFQYLLEAHVQRRLVSELDGAHYRLLIVQWEKIIQPSLQHCEDKMKQDRVKRLFHAMTEVHIENKSCLLFYIPL